MKNVNYCVQYCSRVLLTKKWKKYKFWINLSLVNVLRIFVNILAIFRLNVLIAKDLM